MTFGLYKLILLFCIIRIKFSLCFNCILDDNGRKCNITSNSSITKEINNVEVYVDGNLIKNQNLSQFCQRWRHLEKIKIENVRTLDKNLFQQCRNLKRIEIGPSKIEKLPEILFSANLNLTHIFIRKNKIFSLPEKIFSNQKALWYLYLNENQLSCLPSKIFMPFTKLKELGLSRNKIQSLNKKWFENLQSLVYLYLSSNKIQNLPKNVFINLKKLEYLFLKNNQLTTIHSDSFGNHENLKFIYLNSNQINAIDAKFINNTAVSVIEMDGNICNNEIIETKTEMKEKLKNCTMNYESRPEKCKIILKLSFFSHLI